MAKRSAQDEEKRLARQAEEIKRTRAAEAEAEARRGLMREESRKAELASLAQKSASFSANPEHREAEEFFQLNQGVPHRLNTGPAGAPVEMVLNWIPAGNFLMGGTEADKDARLSSVTLSKGFWLGRTEVTQSQWSGTMDSNPSEQIGPSLPVEQVHWSEAVRFCRLLTEREQRSGRLPKGLAYTLPTEAQWEYACRAGQEGDAPANLAEIAWSMDNSGGKTNPVGGLKTNGWGLHDMFGNVSEWCLDWYAPYEGLNAMDPSGPSEGRRRVNRGGSWLGTLADYRYHRRDKDIPELRSKSIGFRLALVRQ